MLILVLLFVGMSLKKKFAEFDNLPPLAKSQKIQEIADNETNFGYDNKHDILQDLYDEIDELKEELELHDKTGDNIQRIFEELGDVLFVLGNLANRYEIDSAKSLEYSIKEFERRMIYCEEHYNGDVPLKEAPKEEMIRLWKEAKKNK